MHVQSRCAIERYRARLSGPLLDRIDLQVFVGPVSLDELRSREPGESPRRRSASASIAARERQRARLAPWGVRCNAEMTPSVLRESCPLDAIASDKLADLVEERERITARSIDRLIKVARTIADLDRAGRASMSAASTRPRASATSIPRPQLDLRAP